MNGSSCWPPSIYSQTAVAEGVNLRDLWNVGRSDSFSNAKWSRVAVIDENWVVAKRLLKTPERPAEQEKSDTVLFGFLVFSAHSLFFCLWWKWNPFVGPIHRENRQTIRGKEYWLTACREQNDAGRDEGDSWEERGEICCWLLVIARCRCRSPSRETETERLFLLVTCGNAVLYINCQFTRKLPRKWPNGQTRVLTEIKKWIPVT